MSGRAAIALTILLCGWTGWANAQPAPSGATVTAVKAVAGPVKPAESGAVDTAATVGPLAIGAEVRDRSGSAIGHITRLTTDADGRSIAQVRRGVDIFSIPTDALTVRGGVVVSTLSAADLKPDPNGPSH